MAGAVDHLKEVAVQQYGADAAEVENLDAQQLAQFIMRKIATDKYSIDAGQVEGKDTRGLIETLLSGMVVDLLKVDQSKVTPDASFSDLGADSLDMVELLMSI